MAINLSAGSLFGALSDVVGTKSGLALTRERIWKILERDGRFPEFIGVDDEQWLRIGSIAYEELVEAMLYAVGRLEKLNNQLPVTTLVHKYGRDPGTMATITGVSKLFLDFMDRTDWNRPAGTKIDPSPFMIAATDKFGRLGLEMSRDVIEAVAVRLELQSAYHPSMRDWKDVVELEDLFKSEGLLDGPDRFVDQRFIDYIHRNFDDIDAINWRKFEGITAEYFARQGYQVDLGPGRNDDGVDVRVWPKDGSVDRPPAIIVQCKRQQAAVSKVIVKALHADVVHHEAKSGLIVTTSRLSPGARTVCQVRNYPIEEADREKVRSWIGEMRKPGMGVAT